MKKRERQITALYGFSLIRDDILKQDYPPKLFALVPRHSEAIRRRWNIERG